ncbi:hypothetical protein CTAYLR_009254 [Chrysophaeum taylorii]|uniref:UDP-galactopyranose mutase C-terminal domain-containing protein n=1 Tax=Chrysophaeum taylorii TaxID=2483200 RepID=A0AAD7XNN8_9STRA|nr:hypothetical protein CTAYLR_009254 [Chrysophaeum taylorii]
MNLVTQCFAKPQVADETGPFPHRAEEPWRSLNRVEGVCGYDALFASGETSEAPLELDAEVTSGDLGPLKRKRFDLLIVGAGLSGAVIAERCSSLGLTSLVIDSRPHVGGNCYDYVDEAGIRCSKYGAHLFHTKYERVWRYVQQFSEWLPNDHRVRGIVEDVEGEKKLVPIPPTQDTVNTLFPDANIKNEEDMEAWYASQRIAPPNNGVPANGEEAALSRVGPLLYERIFKHYTKKQWDKYPAELDASVLLRLPCRTTTDDRYFGDPWQALPLRGYTRVFENMLLQDPRITVKLNVDFFQAKKLGQLPKFGKLVFTGPIDAYFQGLPKLEYRSLRFEEEFIPEPTGGFYQPAFVVNYPSSDVDFTRIVEYKHVPNQPTPVKQGMVKGTRIAREYSSATGPPYYPVPNPENRALYERYRLLAEQEADVCFVGRLASYKYFNMDQAILNALEIFDTLKETGNLQPKRRPQDFGPGDGPK